MKNHKQIKKPMTIAEKKAFRAGASHGYNKGKDAGFRLGLEVQESIMTRKKKW